jgi:hypothetical protein
VNDNVLCVAACVRDNQRQFMCAYSKRFDGTPNIVEVEVMGMKQIMCWLGEMNMEHEKIQFESDCTQVVQVINNEHTNSSELENIMELCRNILVTNNN